ncbi:hypothetical protein OG21DRAFT_1517105 [Imleria badia]|nr:hypothetical protein OG21DRAFT_1517105 [Imleria badia]
MTNCTVPYRPQAPLKTRILKRQMHSVRRLVEYIQECHTRGNESNAQGERKTGVDTNRVRFRLPHALVPSQSCPPPYSIPDHNREVRECGSCMTHVVLLDLERQRFVSGPVAGGSRSKVHYRPGIDIRPVLENVCILLEAAQMDASTCTTRTAVCFIFVSNQRKKKNK